MRRKIALALLLAPLAARGEKIPFVDLYTTHGRPDRFEIAGRAIRIQSAQLTEVGRSGVSALWHNVRRFAPSEFEGYTIELAAGGAVYDATTDREGLFRVRVEPKKPVPAGFLPVVARVLDLEGKPLEPASTGTVQIIAPGARLALVSDIDDTVLVSQVRERRKLLWNTFGRSVESMRAVTGMADVYGAIASRTPRPAVFYVSGSPVGLHRKLVAFLERNGFPAGSLLLKNLGPRSFVPRRLHAWRPFTWMDPADPLIDSYEYKLTRIFALMDDLPDLSFVLVGDSGERDPEIFRKIANDRPGRVAGIYIRNATGEKAASDRFDREVLFDDPRMILEGLKLAKPRIRTR